MTRTQGNDMDAEATHQEKIVGSLEYTLPFTVFTRVVIFLTCRYSSFACGRWAVKTCRGPGAGVTWQVCC